MEDDELVACEASGYGLLRKTESEELRSDQKFAGRDVHTATTCCHRLDVVNET
jgi:hypothetical protein